MTIRGRRRERARLARIARFWRAVHYYEKRAIDYILKPHPMWVAIENKIK